MTLGQACPPECRRAQYAFKDSMTRWNSAIRITYRISLRSSSTPEPRDPLLKVVSVFPTSTQRLRYRELGGLGLLRRASPDREATVMRSSEGWLGA